MSLHYGCTGRCNCWTHACKCMLWPRGVLYSSSLLDRYSFGPALPALLVFHPCRMPDNVWFPAASNWGSALPALPAQRAGCCPVAGTASCCVYISVGMLLHIHCFRSVQAVPACVLYEWLLDCVLLLALTCLVQALLLSALPPCCCVVAAAGGSLCAACYSSCDLKAGCVQVVQACCGWVM